MRLLPLLVFVCSTAVAQTPDSASIGGRVLDGNGAVIGKAQLHLENPQLGLSRNTGVRADGGFEFPSLPLNGTYTVTVSAPGFGDAKREGLVVRAGEAVRLAIQLDAAGAHTAVMVFGTAEGVRSDSAELGFRVESKELQQLPLLGSKLTFVPMLDSAVRPARGTGDLFLGEQLFVVNGGGRRQTSYMMDGATADDAWGRQTVFATLPLAAVQEVDVLTNALPAEYGRTTGAAVNIVTRAGTAAWHSDLLALWRPSGIEAAAPLAPFRTPDRLLQGSGSFSGPLREHTQFLAAGEWNEQRRSSAITSPLQPGIYQGEYRQKLGLVRVDHQIGDRNLLSARMNLDRFHDTNPQDAVGGNTQPNAARVFERDTYDALLSETSVMSSSVVSEARLQYQIGSPITRFNPVTPSPQIVYPGLATYGDSRFASLMNHQWQMSESLQYVHGRHTVKFGGEAIWSSSGGSGTEFGSAYTLGQFTVKTGVSKPLSQLTTGDIARYVQSFGNPSYKVQEWIPAFHLTDTFRLRPNVTITAGLRYELQTLTDSRKSVAPRFGIAWNPNNDNKTVVRASYGIFYSEIRADVAANYRTGGPDGIFTFTATPGQLGFPTSLAPLPAFPTGAVLPARDINIRPGEAAYLNQFFNLAQLRGYPSQLLNPYTQQVSAGVEREVAHGWIASADYLHQHTIKIDRPLDLNAPAPFPRTQPGQVRTASAADATRPIVPAPNGYRRIIATVNNGNAQYDALQLNLNRRFSERFALKLSYTWSHEIDDVEPDIPSQDPNDANFLGSSERGSGLLDQRHRAVLTGMYRLPGSVWFGTVTSLASGRPYNVTTGADNNGDGSSVDRPVVNGSVIGRNTGVGTPSYEADVYLGKEVHCGERATATVRAEAFNVFNHSSIYGRNGTYGNNADGTPLATFGQPVGGLSSVDPGRAFQFSLRIRF